MVFKKNPIALTVVIAAFVLLGVLLLRSISAASAYFPIFTDSLDLTGSVAKCSGDQEAGGQNYVLFGETCGGGTTPPIVSKVKIATLGDSNTVSGYWSLAFQGELRDNKCSYDMIGSSKVSLWSGQSPSWFDRDSDASSGATISSTRNPSNAMFIKGKTTLDSADANVVIVVGGTNDVSSLRLSSSDHIAVLSDTIVQTKKQLQSAAKTAPDSYFVVASIVYMRGNQATVNEYNSRLKAMVGELSGEMNIQYLNITTTDADLGSDGIHLTATAGAKYGKAIASGTSSLIKAFGVCENSSTGGASNTGKCINQRGYVEPTPGVCVGVPSSVSLSNYTSGMSSNKAIVITQSNITIQNKRFLGCVQIKGRNVTFKNNYVECYKSRDINNSASPYYGNGPVTVDYGATGAVVDHNTLVCKQKNINTAACDYGIFLGQGSATYNDISGIVDAFDPRGGTVIDYNYVHDFGLAYEEWREKAFPNESTHYSHADGVQLYSSGSGNVKIRGNYFKGLNGRSTVEREKGMQAMLIQASSSNNPKPDIIITGNMIKGYWRSLRIACVSNAACLVEGNTIDTFHKANGQAINMGGAHSSSRVRCNTFTDGSLVQSVHIYNGSSDNSNC